MVCCFFSLILVLVSSHPNTVGFTLKKIQVEKVLLVFLTIFQYDYFMMTEKYDFQITLSFIQGVRKFPEKLHVTMLLAKFCIEMQCLPNSHEPYQRYIRQHCTPDSDNQMCNNNLGVKNLYSLTVTNN